MRNLVNLYNFFLVALEESGLQMKLMIVQAKDDEIFNQRQREALISKYPGAKTHLFENGGHILPITRGEEVDNMTEEFLYT